jgi:hypothetical protein
MFLLKAQGDPIMVESNACMKGEGTRRFSFQQNRLARRAQTVARGSSRGASLPSLGCFASMESDSSKKGAKVSKCKCAATY